MKNRSIVNMADEDAPANIDAYKMWASQKFGKILDDKIQNHYDSVTLQIEDQFENSAFWINFTKNFKNYNDTYLLHSEGYDLFIDLNKPKLYRKSYESFIEKTFRKNVLDNDQFPKERKDGWITPDNWFSRVHDILRTQIIVKYLDGVDFIIKEFIRVCEENDLEYDISYEARDEGYYAVHLNSTHNLKILGYDLDLISCPITVEIQIRTQLQEVIKNLLHTYYETKRLTPLEEKMEYRKDWKWDYKCDEFATNYLGHILHYVEGMIMEIREKQMRCENDKT